MASSKEKFLILEFCAKFGTLDSQNESQEGGQLMTANELSYWNLLETQRANRAREEENVRSNKAREGETRRSNLAREAETNRSNLANETETNRSNVTREQETHRSNYVKEGQARNELNEKIRHNKKAESQTDTDLAQKDWKNVQDVAINVAEHERKAQADVWDKEVADDRNAVQAAQVGVNAGKALGDMIMGIFSKPGTTNSTTDSWTDSWNRDGNYTGSKRTITKKIGGTK